MLVIFSTNFLLNEQENPHEKIQKRYATKSTMHECKPIFDGPNICFRLKLPRRK